MAIKIWFILKPDFRFFPALNLLEPGYVFPSGSSSIIPTIQNVERLPFSAGRQSAVSPDNALYPVMLKQGSGMFNSAKGGYI